MDPKVIIPVDHSVALDVKQGDYYGISVLHAKEADYVKNLPTLKPTQTDDDVVAFTIGEESYSKRINNVKNAEVALYDKRGRDLSKFASEETYKTLVQNYLASLSLVQSVNGMTGNVTIPISELEGSIAENAEAIETLRTNTTNSINEVKSDIEATNNELEAFGDSLSSAVLDIDNLEDKSDSNTERISAIESDNTQIHEDVDSMESRVGTNENDITTLKQTTTAHSDDISILVSRVNAAERDIVDLKNATEDIITEAAVDAKIAQAMAAEQIQDEALKARMDSIESQIDHYDDTELRNRIATLETENGQLKTRLSTAEGTITSLQTQIDNLRAIVEAIDLSPYVTTETANATYKNKAECNAQLADLQEQITNNIGRVLTSDPSENNRVWVEQA